MSPLYFAYGSCMNGEDLRKDVARFDVIGPAVLRDHRLGFTRFSHGRAGGVADLVPEPGQQVEGVLYRVPEEELTFLDAREGAPDHYQRTRIRVEGRDGTVYDDVLAYTVVDKAVDEIPPHPDYARTILDGARRNLSYEYVRSLESRLQEEVNRYPDFMRRLGRRKGLGAARALFTRPPDPDGLRAGGSSAAGTRHGRRLHHGRGRRGMRSRTLVRRRGRR